MNRSALLSSYISQKILLFPSKIFKAYLQNIRGAFLFRLWIGIVYHEKNFLITETNNSQIDLGNTEDAVEYPNHKF